MNVSSSDLRAHLKEYLDKLEDEGEEIVIIRHSAIIGRIVPERLPQHLTHSLKDGRQIKFRGYVDKDAAPIRRLHEEALKAVGAFAETDEAEELDLDLDNIDGSYFKLGGDFVVGELDGELVAMGGFRMALGAGIKRAAELKRMRVRPDLWGQGIGSALLKLLEERAAAEGYEIVILDTVADTPAQQFYQSRGYRETRRKRVGRLEIVFYQKEL